MLTEEKKLGIGGKIEEIFGIINGRMKGGNKRGRDEDKTPVINNSNVSNVMFR